MKKSLVLLMNLLSVTRSLVVNVTQTSYQAEENHNITLEWTFTTRDHSSPKSLSIVCYLIADLRPFVLFSFSKGVESPKSQDERFAGRVQFEKDVLRDGQIRVHMSRLRVNDSGVYRCEVRKGQDGSSRRCRLNVTAAAADELKTPPTEPPRPTMSPVWIGLIVGLTAALLVLCAGLCFVFRLYFTKSTVNRGNIYTIV